jgi:hypothetical protein
MWTIYLWINQQFTNDHSYLFWVLQPELIALLCQWQTITYYTLQPIGSTLCTLCTLLVPLIPNTITNKYLMIFKYVMHAVKEIINSAHLSSYREHQSIQWLQSSRWFGGLLIFCWEYGQEILLLRTSLPISIIFLCTGVRSQFFCV